jgi:hypothetical protein
MVPQDHSPTCLFKNKHAKQVLLVTRTLLTRVNPFFSKESTVCDFLAFLEKKSGATSGATSGDFGKFISKSLARAKDPGTMRSMSRSVFVASITAPIGTHCNFKGAHGVRAAGPA